MPKRNSRITFDLPPRSDTVPAPRRAAARPMRCYHSALLSSRQRSHRLEALMTAAVLVVAVLIVGWFAAGSIANVRKGHAAMRWLQGGLPLLGERTTLRWLGTTSVVLAIAKAEPPFEQAALVIFLEPRDVPWLWALARGRGRRDTLIVRAQLRRAPVDDVELLDRQSWSGRDALRR